LQARQRQAVSTIIDAALAGHAIDVCVGLRPVEPPPPAVSCDVVVDRARASATINAYGFSETLAGPSTELAELLRRRIGPVAAVDMYDMGPWASRVADALAGEAVVRRHRSYPARV